MSKNATTSKPKKEFALKKCSDPTRDDWSVLSKLLGRTVSPEGMTEEQAKAALSGLLVEAYAKNCDHLVTAACHSRAAAGAGKKSFLQTIFAALGRNPARRLDFYETIRTRLLMPEDGRDRPVAKANQDKGKGSSYRMLEYWEPDKMGVLPYVRARVTHIINGMKEEIQERNRMVSFTQLDATNTGLHLDSDGVGRVVRQRSHKEMDDDTDIQELHEAGMDVGENARLASPEDEIVELGEGLGGAGGELGDEMGSPREKLPATHKGVQMLDRLLDSVLSEETVNKSPLFEPAFVEALAENNVTLGVFKDLKGLMAEPGKSERADEIDARISAEMTIVREVVTVLGGIHRLPEETSIRLTEALREFSPDEETPEETDLGDERAAAKNVAAVVSQGGDQRLAYAFGQNRKQLTAYAKANRPEFELFGLLLGETISPAESPEARYTQLRELAKRVATEKCQGMNIDPEDERVEVAVEEWDPSSSSFGRRFPDVLDHLESETTRALEQRAAAAIAAAKAAVEAKNQKPLKVAVEQSGQTNFFESIAVKKGTPTLAIETFKSSLAEEATERSLTSVDRDVRSIEELIGDPAIQEAFAIRNVLETGFWTAICHDEDELDSPERVDYKFLCSKLGIDPDPDIAGEDLHRSVKAMAVAWIGKVTNARVDAGRISKSLNIDTGGKLSLEGRFNRDLIAATEAYDPARDGFFSQALNDFFKDQIAQDIESRRRGPRKKASNPEESVAMPVMSAPGHPEPAVSVAGKDDYTP